MTMNPPGQGRRGTAHFINSLAEKRPGRESISDKWAASAARAAEADGGDPPADADETAAEADKAAADPAAETKAAAEARARLIREMRARPEVCANLGLPDRVFDEDIMRFLAQLDDLRYALRKAGCGAVDAVQIANLLPLALAAPPPQERKPLCKRRWIFIFFCILGIVGLIVLMIWLQAQASDGWRFGICNLANFGNYNTCVHETCKLEVQLREDGKPRTYYLNDWDPPLEPVSYREDRVKLRGDPFRCCDSSEKFDCCQLLNPALYAFCDNWPWLDDAEGNPCPEGDWDCLFKGEEDSSGFLQVTEIQVYEPLSLWPFILGIIILIALILCALSMDVWKRLAMKFYEAVSAERLFREEEIRQLRRSPTGQLMTTEDDEKDEPHEKVESVTAHAVEDGQQAAAAPEEEGTEALKKQSLRPESGKALVQASLDSAHAEPTANEPRLSPRLEDVEKNTDSGSQAPLPPEVAHVPSKISGSSQAVASVRHGSKGSMKRGMSGMSNNLYLPSPPTPVPEAPEPPDAFGIDAHPAFKYGDLSQHAQQPLGELLQPIIAPLPHNRFRSRKRALAGSSSSGSRPGSVATTVGSHPTSYAASHAGSQAPGHLDIHMREDGSRQSLRVTAHGTDRRRFPGNDGRGQGQFSPQSASPITSPSRGVHSPASNGSRRARPLVDSSGAVKHAAVRGVLLSPASRKQRMHLEPQFA